MIAYTRHVIEACPAARVALWLGVLAGCTPEAVVSGGASGADAETQSDTGAEADSGAETPSRPPAPGTQPMMMNPPPADDEDAGTPDSCQADCPPEHPCLPATGQCDCARPNVDRDGADAIVCGGSDCDDDDPAVHPLAQERCDELGVDEDCNPRTYYSPNDGDKDGDRHIDVACFNRDPKTGAVFVAPDGQARSIGDDCNDKSPVVYPYNSEVCDYVDNDCDSVIDEGLNSDGTGTGMQGELRETFYPDRDADGCGDRQGEPVRACDFMPPAGYVLGIEPCDCDDDDASSYRGAAELCDGADNDCDELTDAADPDIETKFAPPTLVECREASWFITACPERQLWCDQSTIEDGCETDATKLSSCGACRTECAFSCGAGACDEIVKLSAGLHHTCAVTAQHRAACWGRGGDGRLGNDSSDSALVPTLVELTDVADISAGREHSCAIAGSDHVVYCWGNNASGQVGTVDAGAFTARPIAVYGGTVNPTFLRDTVSVAAGSTHSCALLEGGRVACWGETANGRLGDQSVGTGTQSAHLVVHPDIIDGQSVVAELGNAQAIAVGDAHSCLLTQEGMVECWGDNSLGQLGFGTELPERNFADRVPMLSDVSAIGAGANHTCALVSGDAYCWGSNYSGALGRASTETDHLPALVSGLGTAVAIAAGFDYTCAVFEDGTVQCWGEHGYAGLQGTDPPPNHEPFAIALPAAIEIAAGGHTCARTDRQVLCWGSNEFGELGTGRTSDVLQGAAPILSLTGSKP